MAREVMMRLFRHGRPMTDAEMDEQKAAIRQLANEHPEAIPRKVGEFVNLIVQGCKAQDHYLVDLGHVSLQALGLELAERIIHEQRSGGDGA